MNYDKLSQVFFPYVFLLVLGHEKQELKCIALHIVLHRDFQMCVSIKLNIVIIAILCVLTKIM